MKMFYLVFITLLFTSISLFLILALFRTWKTQTGANQKLFLSGRVPSSLPEGFYKGSVTGLKTTWKGKKFDVKKSTGINVIGDKDRYPFKTYVGKGIQDSKLDVIKIDYNISENPLWLRFILDEIVEVEKNSYLGKVHLTFIPFIPISLGYFRLEK